LIRVVVEIGFSTKKNSRQKEGIRRSHFARTVHSHHPFPATGDAAYHQPAGGDRATDIDNMHRKIDEDRAYGSGDILVDRQTHRQTDRRTDILITFAAAPTGDVTTES